MEEEMNMMPPEEEMEDEEMEDEDMEDEDMEDEDMEDEDMEDGEFEIPEPGEEPAVIKGFEPGGMEKLELPHDVEYDDLELVRKGKNTQIKLGKDVLATVRGVRPNQLSMDDFEMHEHGEFELPEPGEEPAIIKGFEPGGMEKLELPDDVEYDDLELVRKGKNTQIKLGKDVLATVRGVRPNQLSMDDFEMDEDMEEMDVTELLKDAKLYTKGFKEGKIGVGRMGSDLVIDWNQNGVFDDDEDPEIEDFFKKDKGKQKGPGYLKKLGNRKGGQLLGVPELPPDMEDMDVEELLKDTKLYTKGFKEGKIGVGRMGSDLLIDWNKDGVFDEDDDAEIEDFFKKDKGKQKGPGYIKKLGNRNGGQLLKVAELPDELINGGGEGMEEGEKFLLPDPGPGVTTIRQFEDGDMFMLPDGVEFGDLDIAPNGKGTWTFIGAEDDRLARVKGTPELTEEDFVPFSEDMMM